MRFSHPDGESTVGVELVFIALDREEDVNKLQSLELTGAHINEATEIPRGVHQMLKSRVNRYPEQNVGGPVRPFIICDYNACDTEHWLYKIAEEEKPPKHGFYSQPSALILTDSTDPRVDPDNPVIDKAGNYYVVNPDADNVINLPEDYYSDLVFGAEPDWVSVMVLNAYGQLRTGRPVYSEYYDDIHYTSKNLQPIKGVKIIVGMDLGLTPAAAFMQLTPSGHLVVFDELVTEDCSIQKFCEDYLKSKLQNEYSKYNYELIIDPAATQRSQNDARSAAEIIGGRPPYGSGLPYSTAPTNNITKRREAVVYFLRKVKGFMLGPRCTYLRKGFISEYKYERKRLAIMAASTDPQFKEKPEKNIYSHIHDALQYGALELSGGRTAKRRRRRPLAKNQHEGPSDAEAGY
jgi:hypothetical protein